MTAAIRCHQCGASLADDALFCKQCGIDVSGQHGPAATAEMPADQVAAARVQASMRQALRDATLGEYEILAELGRGGMAVVFLAHDIALDRKVAVKVMAPHLLEGEGMLERFKLEARTAAQLSHPHIIPIYAVKETAEVVYFAMKFIEGRPLDAIIKKMGPLPIPMVQEILGKVGEALGYAHRRDVIHRDVKPGNIMIDEEGTPIVTDFGIAKVTQGQHLTMTGAAIGTPSYMSPEQCEAGDLTGASDQYSLGIVAFEMLTGKLPFTGESAVSIMYKHCHDPLPPLEDFRPDCPPEMREAVVRMLAKDPADRWPTLEAAVQKLGTRSPLAYDDPVRTQVIEVIKEGGHREILARIRTPRSPVPSTRSPAVEAPPASAGTKSRSLWTSVVLVVLLVGAGVAAGSVVRPWEWAGGSPLPGSEAAEPAQTSAPSSSASSGAVLSGAGDDASDPGASSPAGPAEASVGGSGGIAESGPSAAGPGSSAGVTDTVAGAGPDVGASTSSASGSSGTGALPTTSPPSGSPTPVAVRISNVPARLSPDEAVSLSATGLDAGGASVPSGVVTWRSSDPAVATVSSGGLVTAIRPGEATISAAVGGASGSATIVVAPEAVVAVPVEPARQLLEPGQSTTLTARPRGASGRLLDGRSLVWTSSDPNVAAVDSEGIVTAVAAGTATISAMSEGVSGTATIAVVRPEVDQRTAVTRIIERYARALESGELDRIREAYPGITTGQERQLAQALQSMRDLRASLRIVGIERAAEDQVIARVEGTYTFLNTSTRREEQAPVTFRAIFERGPDGWQLVRTQ